MSNYAKEMITFTSSLLIIVFVISCTPGKAQTRSDLNRNNAYSENTYEFDHNQSKNDYKNSVRTSSESEFLQDGGIDKYSQNGRNSDFNTVSDDNNRNIREKFFQVGKASWYGREFHGKVTASGERFNMYELTAAHKNLPFGTVLRVKNLDNGMDVIVRINDRGPYKGKRILDLSYGAAKNIELISAGEGNIGIEILKKGEDKYYTGRNEYVQQGNKVEPVVDDSFGDESYMDNNSANYLLQVGAFYSKKNAINLKRRVQGLMDNSVTVIQDGDLYKVRVEGISNRREVEKFRRILSEEDIPSYLIDTRE